jgi:hypothetical protein
MLLSFRVKKQVQVHTERRLHGWRVADEFPFDSITYSGGGAREGESVVIVNVTLLSIICGVASCRGQDLSGWCPAAVGMCSTPMGGPPQLWMTKLRVSCGFYELVVTPPTEKR